MRMSEAPVLDDAAFARLRQLVGERTGIQLGEHKRQLCQTRLMRRLRALELDSFAAYLAVLDDAGSDEHGELVNAITTNVTAFFREPHHFELLARRVVPELARRDGRVRLWSAGCSSGEEPWTIAMVADEAGLAPPRDIRILATDIDTDVVARAGAAIYPDERMAQVSDARRRRYFERGVGARSGHWRIAAALRDRVAFRSLNLFDPWPMRGAFDVIFCRNVIIYFDAPSKARLVRRFADLLAPGGYLFLGHSESLIHDVPGLEPCGQTVYRKAAR